MGGEGAEKYRTILPLGDLWLSISLMTGIDVGAAIGVDGNICLWV